jgi:hypothetical protein
MVSKQFMVKRKNQGKNKTENIIPSESLSLIRSTKYPSPEVLPNFLAISPSNQSNKIVIIRKIIDMTGEMRKKRTNSIDVNIDKPETTFGFTFGKGKANPNLSTLFLKLFTERNFVFSAKTTPPLSM